MIYGVGTDIVHITRIIKALQHSGEKFEKKILGTQEIEKYLQRKAKSKILGNHFLASRFAVKEAFSKALGLGMRMPMTWHGIQTLNDDSGKPIIITGPLLKEYMVEKQLISHVSITDEVEYSFAFVVVEKMLCVS